MKKSIVMFVLAVVLMSAAPALSEPTLTSDPQDGVTKYRVRLGPAAEWTEADATAEGAAWFPLSAWPRGKYPTCEIQAGGNVKITDTTTGAVTEGWQWSASAPFAYEKMTGEKPSGIKMITGP